MCGEAACAFSASRLSHFSITTKVSEPYLAPGPPSASAAGPYSMQPCSACTAGMLARNAASTSSRLPGLAVMMAMTWIMVSAPVRFSTSRGRINGSHVAEQLLEAGAGEVILFDNYALGSPEVAAFLARDKRVKVVRGDITRLYELIDALDGVDGVFALAGFLTLPLSQNPGLGLDVNVRGMFNIVEACRHRGVKKVVFSSSVATFGDPEADAVDETTPFRWHTAPPALALYASSKRSE